MIELNFTSLEGCDDKDLPGNSGRGWTQALRHSKENMGLTSMSQTVFGFTPVFPDRYAMMEEWESVCHWPAWGICGVG